MCGESWPITGQAGAGGRYGARKRWVVNFTHGPFIPCTRCTGECVGLGAGVDGSGKPRPHRVRTACNKSPYAIPTAKQKGSYRFQ
jgi:hypothetical protein